MRLHPSLTTDRILEAVERSNTGLDDPGFCNTCGVEAHGCEPDMRRGKCEICGEKAVYGAEELMFHVIV